MRHVLDRPVWSALTTRHAALAQGDGPARRYDPSIAPFAATADDDPASLAALAALVAPGESVLMLQADDIMLPPALAPLSAATGVQMVASRSMPRIADERVEPLSQDDAADMLALATLTRPGPFSLRALDLGAFWGIRIGGRLAAMAGERMRQPGFTELSGVCAHPDVRGRGLGRVLSLFVAGEICARGETPYLHAYATNAPAIALYESIGFALRRTVNVAVAGKPA